MDKKQKLIDEWFNLMEVPEILEIARVFAYINFSEAEIADNIRDKKKFIVATERAKEDRDAFYFRHGKAEHDANKGD